MVMAHLKLQFVSILLLPRGDVQSWGCSRVNSGAWELVKLGVVQFDRFRISKFIQEILTKSLPSIRPGTLKNKPSIRPDSLKNAMPSSRPDNLKNALPSSRPGNLKNAQPSIRSAQFNDSKDRLP